MTFPEHSAPLIHSLCLALQKFPSFYLCLIGKSLVSPIPLGLIGLYALTKYLPASSSTSHLEDDILVVPNPAFHSLSPAIRNPCSSSAWLGPTNVPIHFPATPCHSFNNRLSCCCILSDFTVYLKPSACSLDTSIAPSCQSQPEYVDNHNR